MATWEQFECDFLCNHYNDMTWDEMANALGRTRNSVYNKGLDLGIVIKKTKKIRPRRKNKNETLCWECRHATNPEGVCPWSRSFIPVPGWDAKPHTLYVSARYQKHQIKSFLVRQCPLYEEG